MKELTITLRGKVQGVGMRAFVKKYADSFGLLGYVRNDPEGFVEVTAQGDEEKLNQFLEKVSEGPYFAKVKEMETEWYDTLQDGFTEFTILS